MPLVLLLLALSACADDPEPCRAGDIGNAHEKYPPDAFVRVPAGTYRVGPGPESSYRWGEYLRRATRSGDVTFTYDLLVSATEVTNAQWNEIFDENPTPSTDPDCDDCPVHYVDVAQAMAYCNERSRREGFTPCYELNECLEVRGREIVYSEDSRFCGNAELVAGCDGYRLPDMFEYERFARAGGDLDYWCGMSGGLCVFYREWVPTLLYQPDAPEVSYEASGEIFRSREFRADPDRPILPQPVATSCPNRWGIYDVHGNAAEILWQVTDLPFGEFGEATDATSPTAAYVSEQYEDIVGPTPVHAAMVGGTAFFDVRPAAGYDPQFYRPTDIEQRLGTGFRVVRAVPPE